MERVTLDRFLSRTVVYERLPVEVSPGLRRSVWISSLVITAFATLCHFFPDGSTLQGSQFFLLKPAWMVDIWDFLANNRLALSTCSLVVLGLALIMLIPTRLYRWGEASLQMVLFIPVVFASTSLLFSAVLLVPVMVNLAAWLVIITVAVLLLIAILLILFGVFTRSQ